MSNAFDVVHVCKCPLHFVFQMCQLGIRWHLCCRGLQNTVVAFWIALLQPEVGGGNDSSLSCMEHAPHVGTLFLDPSAGGQVITNAVTQEQIRLDGTGWSLFEGEGFYVVVRTRPADEHGHAEQAECMSLSDVFNIVLFKDV